MGARQRGQNRQKQGKAGGPKNSPHVSQKKSSSSMQVPTLDSSFRAQALQGWQQYASNTSASHDGFSLRQEAQNTERHDFGWSSGPLRSKGISFVSAGNLTREEIPSEEREAPEVDAVSVLAGDLSDFGGPDQAHALLARDAALNQTPTVESTLRDTDVAVDGTQPTGDSVQEHGWRSPASQGKQRADSQSSSSSDEVVFAGRQKGVVVRSVRQPTVEAKSSGLLTAESTALPTRMRSPVTRPIETSTALAVPQQVSSASPSPPRPMPHQRRMNSRLRRRGRRPQREVDEEEALMQDYIDNLAMNDDDDKDNAASDDPPVVKNEHYRYYDGAGEENVKVRVTRSRDGKRPTVRQIEDLDTPIDWDSDDLDAFDGISTTDEEILEVEQVLRKRQRPTGLQYLVSGIGRGVSDAKWTLHARLTTKTAQEEIRIFEEIRRMRNDGLLDDTAEDTSEDDDNDEDEEALNDLVDKIESEDEENARILRRTAKMTDEEIARALAKQEELGIGGDEVMIFDGAISDESSDDAFEKAPDFVPFSASKGNKGRSYGAGNRSRKSDGFPSAEAFADALDQDPYGAFDVMDFDRPSLRPKKKGRKGDFPFEIELDDEDLVEQLRSTWTKDRDKKAARKREKAEAKAAAMLDFISSDPDSIKSAVRAFLVQDREALTLPPMAAHTRATIHRLAKALSLKSHSHGKGDSRHPVLTKTPHTHEYTIDTIWEIDALMNQRKFFPGSAGFYKSGNVKMPRSGASGPRTRRGGGGVLAGASYADGEVVGASAPAIGEGNRGRAMLEKMGWSNGMAIGAVGNKGSVEVIKHVVKNTKAGLG